MKYDGKFHPSRVLKPTKQRLFKRQLFGFDIETYENNTKISLISLWSENFQKTYRSAEAFILDLKTERIFRDCYIVATNLSFDFFGTFWNNSELGKFTTIPKGNTSNILTAKVFVRDNQFVKHGSAVDDKKARSITFLDTGNYTIDSVENMGRMMGLPKLTKPECVDLQIYPRTSDEEKELIEYNLRDSEISYKFLKYLIKTFESLGATFKITIASTSMTLFTNKYLKIPLFRAQEDELYEIFESYIGGRTEVFGRGSLWQLMRKYNVEKLYYVDINSLYPSVMRDFVYPNPNTRRVVQRNTTEYINRYHGCSLVDVVSPRKLRVPFLPFRSKDKILFSLGSFTGWYTHVELREAIKLGYTITTVKKTYYYLETFEPFKDYINDLYNLRQQYKKEGNAICELVVKLFMNSLYGKFGQRFFDKQKTVPVPDTSDELALMKDFTIVKQGTTEFIRLNHQVTEPSAFCIPILASYITSYARIRLYSYLSNYRVVYCDTDSCISLDPIPTSLNLGEMKFEGHLEKGFIVRSKFYGYMGVDHKGKVIDSVKIKGVSIRMKCKDLDEYLHQPKTISYKKLVKWKEAIRREMHINSVTDVRKDLSFNDDKHLWNREFSPDEWQWGDSLILENAQFYTRRIGSEA